MYCSVSLTLLLRMCTWACACACVRVVKIVLTHSHTCIFIIVLSHINGTVFVNLLKLILAHLGNTALDSSSPQSLRKENSKSKDINRDSPLQQWHESSRQASCCNYRSVHERLQRRRLIYLCAHFEIIVMAVIKVGYIVTLRIVD